MRRLGLRPCLSPATSAARALGERWVATVLRRGLALGVLAGLTGSGACRTGWEFGVAQAAPFRARGDGAAACRGHGHDVAWLVSRGPPLRRHSVAGDRSTDERAADRRLIEPLRCHHGGSQRVPASMRCPAALGWPKPARLSGGIHAGVVGGRSGAAGSTSLCSLCRARGGTGCARGVGARGRADALIGVIETRPGVGCDTSHRRQPWYSASGATRAAGEQGAVHAQPRSSAHATCTRARSRRRPGPQLGPTATTRAAKVHRRGATAGRRGRPPPCARADRGNR
jgi:hypothetical protein